MTLAKTVFAGLFGALAATACTPIETDTGNPRQRTTEGAAIGAIAGAALGAAIGDSAEERRRGAAIGALVGGAAGGAIGDTLDRQAAALQSSVSSNTQIINTGNELLVRMPQDILFATDSATLRPDLQADLRAVARNLIDYPNSTIVIVGHTDNTGSAAYNQALSERRANAVASALISNGVPAYRVRGIGRGEDQPIATNQTPEGRAQNRRVDITIQPN